MSALLKRAEDCSSKLSDEMALIKLTRERIRTTQAQVDDTEPESEQLIEYEKR